MWKNFKEETKKQIKVACCRSKHALTAGGEFPCGGGRQGHGTPVPGGRDRLYNS